VYLEYVYFHILRVFFKKKLFQINYFIFSYYFDILVLKKYFFMFSNYFSIHLMFCDVFKYFKGMTNNVIVSYLKKKLYPINIFS